MSITVTFYVKAFEVGKRYPTMKKVVVETGEDTMEGAFLCAVKNGANPDKLIKYSFSEQPCSLSMNSQL